MAEDLLRLAEDRARSSALGVDAEALRLRLARDLRELGDLAGESGVGGELGSQRPGRQLLLEARPRLIVGKRRGVDPEQLRNRAGGCAVGRAGDEEAGTVERVGAGGGWEIERVRRVAHRGIGLRALLGVARRVRDELVRGRCRCSRQRQGAHQSEHDEQQSRRACRD